MRRIMCLMGAAMLGLPAASAADKGPRPGITLDDVKFGSTIFGSEPRPEALKGKVVVCERWATTCGPCVQFLPELARIHKKYDSRGLEVIGFMAWGDVELAKKMSDDGRVEFPIVKGGKLPYAGDGTVPFALVFGVDGKLAWSGKPTGDEFIKVIRQELRRVGEEPDEPAKPETNDRVLIPTRTWVNADGKSIVAEVLEADDAKVVFRIQGKVVPYEIAKLSGADRELIEKARERAGN